MEMFSLKGKRALVTGATQGIGFAIAAALSAAGATVYVNGVSSPEKCAAAAAKIEGAIPVCADLGAPDCAETLYAATGDIDILVLNASVQYRHAWDAITEEEARTQLSVNFLASLSLIQKYAPAMQKKKSGRIVTVGSVQQTKPHKDMLVYAASKAAQMNMVENLAKQLAPCGITVNNLSPGVIATPRNEAALADPEYSKKVMAGIPLGYAGVAEDCAGAALLLCSEAGRYITGTDLVVDGGMHL